MYVSSSCCFFFTIPGVLAFSLLSFCVMLAMPSYNGLIHLSPQNALPAGKCYSIEEEDAVISLQSSSADRFLPRATRRRKSNRVLEDFARDDFRMYEYKVRRCVRGRSHDWKDCPFTHPGEKARRRDPRIIHYSSSPCPDFRKGSCQRGDACDHAHGVFECWLHPARYRTQACKDGKSCTRRVCFFAHSTQELRHVVVPVEESLTERAPMVDSHTHDSGSPLLLEDCCKGRVSMVDSHECEFGLPSQTDSSEDCLTAVVDSPNNSPWGAVSTVGLSSQDVFGNVGSVSETLSMLTLSSQNVLSSPLEALSALGFSSNNPMGIPLDMVSMVHPPCPNFPGVAPGPSNASSEMGATSQDDSFTFGWASAPAVFSPPSNLQLYTPFVGGLSSSECPTTSEHLSYVGGSPSQQAAAWQTFLMHEGYSGGEESTFSVTADEFSDMVYYGGYGAGAVQEAYLNRMGRGIHDVNEVANHLNGAYKSMSLTDQLALLRKEMYKFSGYHAYGRYGLASPTSTLAGPLYSPSFSSPPLSPLSTTPSSEATTVFSSRGHGNMHVDGTSPMADVYIQNRHCKKEVEFNHTFTDQQSLHSHHHNRVLGHGKVNTVLSPYLEAPSFSQCRFGQNKWSPPCNNWNSEGTYNCNALQLKFDMQRKICGRFGGERPAENAMPDLGWVHELVI